MMKTKLVQLQNVTAEEFKEEILKGVKDELIAFHKSIEKKQPSIYITRKEAGALLGVSLVTISEWTSKKILKAYRIGGNRVRFKREEIEQTLHDSTRQ